MSNQIDRLKHSQRTTTRKSLVKLTVCMAVIGGLASYVRYKARKAERIHPPKGKFQEVDGVRLHYLDTQRGRSTVLLIHGNGSVAEEMEISGLIHKLASKYRVIVYDRPGFGYSSSDKHRYWTPARQAELFYAALRRKDINRAFVLGHSWGSLIAIELALAHPNFLRGLVLVGGYYFPTPRLDTLMAAIYATPIVGDIFCHTFLPLVARALAPAMLRKIFSPKPVSDAFARQFPLELSLRPKTLKVSAEESAMMVPEAMKLRSRYNRVKVPTVIIAGAQDRICDPGTHSVRLHKMIAGSHLLIRPGVGHMLHHSEPEVVGRAIDMIRTIRRSTARA